MLSLCSRPHLAPIQFTSLPRVRCRPTRAATCPQCPARWGSLTASSCAPAGSEGRAGERPCCLLGVGAPVETEASPVLGSPPSFPAPGCLVTAACGQQPGRTRFQSRPPWATCAGAPPLASWPHRESERAGAGVVHGLARSGGSEPAYAALPGAQACDCRPRLSCCCTRWTGGPQRAWAGPSWGRGGTGPATAPHGWGRLCSIFSVTRPCCPMSGQNPGTRGERLWQALLHPALGGHPASCPHELSPGLSSSLCPGLADKRSQ